MTMYLLMYGMCLCLRAYVCSDMNIYMLTHIWTMCIFKQYWYFINFLSHISLLTECCIFYIIRIKLKKMKMSMGSFFSSVSKKHAFLLPAFWNISVPIKKYGFLPNTSPLLTSNSFVVLDPPTKIKWWWKNLMLIRSPYCLCKALKTVKKKQHICGKTI